MVFYPGQFCATVYCKEVKLERKYLNLPYGVRRNRGFIQWTQAASKLIAPHLFPNTREGSTKGTSHTPSFLHGPEVYPTRFCSYRQQIIGIANPGFLSTHWTHIAQTIPSPVPLVLRSRQIKTPSVLHSITLDGTCPTPKNRPPSPSPAVPSSQLEQW